MANYQQRQSSHVNRKKISISYVICEKEERRHRAGINSLQYDENSERLYTAGRDSVIRVWSFEDNHPESKQNHHDVKDDWYLHSMEHHTDWVNDIVLCSNGHNLISVSNDTTIKVWSAQQGFCLSTLRSHKDYAKRLAYAKDREVVASAGFDRIIYLWDIHALTSLTASKNTVTTKPLDGSKSSIYSLAINQSGTLIASGSTEKIIRLWDPRSRQKLLKLRGHTDNVRSLLLSKDGSLLLSASSDGTIRLWSIGQQRCISIIRIHDEGVWTLQSDESFGKVYSGGKDGKVFMTDLKNTLDTRLVCVESAPILSILLVNKSYSRGRISPDSGPSLWITTTNSSVKNWSLRSHHTIGNCEDGFSGRDSYHKRDDQTEITVNSLSDLVIEGGPAVTNYHILNDKRHIITLESDNSVVLYDVLTARKVEDLHKSGGSLFEAKSFYDSEIKRRFRMVYVPNWFSVDLKIGLLCIHLEENECLSAWVSAREYGFMPQLEGQDPKVNLGCLMLQALMEHWPPTYINYGNDQNPHDCVAANSSPNNQNSQMTGRSQLKDQLMDKGQTPNGVTERIGNQYFSIADHISIIVSEGNQTLVKFTASEACNENEDLCLREIIPPWISDVVVARCQPKFMKVPFYLLPHQDSGIKTSRKERLSASDTLQMRKVVEHVCEKMIVNVMEENAMNPSDQPVSSVSSETTKSMIDRVELFCNDQKLDESLDLRTVKHFIWKSGGDLVLHYMPIK